MNLLPNLVKLALATALPLAGLQATNAEAAASVRPPVTIKIVAVNDFHGNLQSPGTYRRDLSSAAVAAGGVDVLAAYVAAARAANPNTVVVSAGDMIGASPLISAFFHDEGTIETMNRLGLDFDAVGNHEFDDGKSELLRMQNGGCHADPANTCKGAVVGTPTPFEGAKFRFLAANVFDTATGKTIFPPYGIKVMNGVRIAFIGMTLKETPTIVTPSGVAGLEFRDEAETVNALIPQLRARGVEAIVVLLHQGGFQDITANPSITDINACVSAGGANTLDASDTSKHFKDLVARFNDAVDLVISGHTHAAYNCVLPNAAGRLIPVTSASAFGRVLTDIDVAIDPASRQVLSVVPTNKVVDRTALAGNPAIRSIVDKYSDLVSPLANTVIGSISSALANSADSAGNMPAGELIADSQLAATARADYGSAVIAFMNPGGVRSPGFTYAQQAALQEGDGNVTYGEAFTVQPFGNSLVTMTLSVADLKQTLEQQFGGCFGQTANRLLPPSAGFSYSWDATQACGHKVFDVKLRQGALTTTLVDCSGNVVSPWPTLRVTVNNFLSTGGDNFTTLKNGSELLGGAQDIDALAAYLSSYKTADGHAPYDRAAANTSGPRITRVAGHSCAP